MLFEVIYVPGRVEEPNVVRKDTELQQKSGGRGSSAGELKQKTGDGVRGTQTSQFQSPKPNITVPEIYSGGEKIKADTKEFSVRYVPGAGPLQNPVELGN